MNPRGSRKPERDGGLTDEMLAVIASMPADFDPHAPIESIEAHFTEANRVMRERVAK